MTSIAQELRRKFRPLLSQYQIAADLQNLRMRTGDFTGYLRKFNSLRSQLETPWQEPMLSFQFTRGLTPEFEQEVLFAQAADFNAAVELAMRFDQTRRTGNSSSGRSILSDNARHVTFSPGRSRHSRSPARSPRTHSSST